MEVSLAARALPIFLTPSYLTRHADQGNDLAVSSATTLRHRLYDMDPSAPWTGTNASDAVDETVTAGIWLPGARVSRDIDFIAVLGHNLLAFDLDFSNDNGATYPGANQKVYTALSASYKVASFSTAIAADKVKLTAHTTQTANQYKEIGTIVYAEALLQAPIGMSLFKQLPKRVKERRATMYDNSIRSSKVYRSDAIYHFQDFRVGFTGLSDSEADAMEAVLLGDDPFIFIPEPGDRPDKMYFGQVANGTYTRDYAVLSKSGGWAISFDFEEIGGS